MMKKRRIVSFFLSIAMLATMFPASAFAADANTQSTERVADDVIFTKDAKWDDTTYKNATIQLAIGGGMVGKATTSNVVVIMDRSGSMSQEVMEPSSGKVCPGKHEHLTSTTATVNTQLVTCSIIEALYGKEQAFSRAFYPENADAYSRHVNRMEMAKYFANEFATDVLSNSESRVALAAFSNTASTIQNFTANANEMKTAIYNIKDSFDTTSYDSAFAQAQKIIKEMPADRKQYRTYVIFLTDGKPQPTDKTGVQQSKALRTEEQYKTGGVSPHISGISYGLNKSVVEIAEANIKEVADNYYPAVGPNGLADALTGIKVSLGMLVPAAAPLRVMDNIAYKFKIRDGWTHPGVTVTDLTDDKGNPIQRVTWEIEKTMVGMQVLDIPIEVRDAYKTEKFDKEPTNYKDAVVSFTDSAGYQYGKNARTEGLDRPAPNPNDAYISYNKNAAGATSSIEPQKVTVGGKAVLSDGTGMSYPGYELSGWAETSQGEVKYKTGAEIAKVNGSMTLYAVWKSSDSAYYSVLYKGGTEDVAGVTKALKGSPIKLESAKEQQVRAQYPNYNLSGWKTEDGKTLNYNRAETVTLGAQTPTTKTTYEVIAQWDAVVIFKLPAGATQTVPGSTYYEDPIKKEFVQFPEISVSGHWVNKKTGNAVADEAKEPIVEGTTYEFVIGAAEPKDKFNLTFVGSTGGTVTVNNKFTDIAKDTTVGTVVGQKAPVPTPETGYAFVGWQAEGSTETKTIEQIADDKITKDTTYTAIFEKEDVNITITFDPDGGKMVDPARENYSVSPGGSFNEEKVIASKDGMKFMGWLQGTETTPKFTDGKVKIENVTAPVTFKAVYATARTITVKYYEENVELGVWDIRNDKTDTITFGYGEKFIIGDGGFVNTALPSAHMEFEGVYPKATIKPGSDSLKMKLKEYTVDSATPTEISVFWNRKTYNLRIQENFGDKVEGSPYELKNHTPIVQAAEGKIKSDKPGDDDYQNATSTIPAPGYKVEIDGLLPDGVTSKRNEEDGSITLGGKLTKATNTVKFIHSFDPTQWFVIKYESNNGDGFKELPNKVVIGSTPEVLEYNHADLKFSNKNYAFEYWTTEDGTKYNPKDPNSNKLAAITGNVTLTAHWKADVKFESKDAIANINNSVSGGTTSYNNPQEDKLKFPPKENLKPPYGYQVEGGYWVEKGTENHVDETTKPKDGMTYEYIFATRYQVSVKFESDSNTKLEGQKSLSGFKNDTIGQMLVDGRELPTVTANDGYDFRGWVLKGTEATAEPMSEEELKAQVMTADTTTYVALSKPKPYTVTFNPNGGAIDKESTDGQGALLEGNYVYEVRHGQTGFSKTVKATKADGKFIGWSTEPGTLWSETSKIKENPVSIPTIEGDKTYYAVYVPVKNITVNYYEQKTDGIYEKTDSKPLAINLGESLTIGKIDSSNINISSTKPYLTNGVAYKIDIATKPTDTANLLAEGSHMESEITGNVISVFFDRKGYKITYDANNKAEQSKLFENQREGSPHKVLDYKNEELKFDDGGYRFVQWVSGSNNYMPDASFTVPGTDTVFKAVWKADVSFDVEGGKLSGGQTEYSDPKTDGFVKFPTVAPDENHVGGGKWNQVDQDGNKTEVTDPLKVPVKDGDKFVFVYDKGKITVVFDAAAHGKMADGAKTNTYADKEFDLTLGTIIGSAVLPSVVTDSEGWILDGWYTAEGVKLSVENLAAVTGAKVGQSITYTARYNARVTLDPDGGTLPGDQDPTTQVPDGGKLPEIKPPAKDDGSDFEGWFDKETGNEVKPGDPIDKPLDLVARYSKLSVTKTQTVEPKGAAHTGVRVGDVVNYTITVKNDGQKQASNVTVQDSMFDGRVSEVSVKVGEAAAQMVKPQSGVLSLGTIAAETTVVVTYSYVVADGDEGKTVKNVAMLSVNGKTDEDKQKETETDRIEQRQEVKLYYAVETLNADASDTTAPTEDTVGVVIARKYPGETLTKDEIIAAIASNVENKLDSASIDLAGRLLSVNGGKAEAEINDYTVVLGQSGSKLNKLVAAYPLKRYTLTYQPGANGTIDLGENAKGEKQTDGSIVFTVPHGAVPGRWFSSDKYGALSVNAKANEGFFPNGWDKNLDMTQPVLENKIITAAWRSNKLSFTVEMYVNGKLSVTRTDVGVMESADATTATAKLNAATLLAEEQAKGTITQGYKFKSFTAAGTETTAVEQNFTVTDKSVIRVDYVPYNLTVWHVYDTYQVLGTQMDIVKPEQVKADPSVFNLSRMNYDSTQVSINGVTDTSKTYTEAVDVPMDGNSYVVTFKYYRASDNSGGGGTGGGGTGGGTGGGGTGGGGTGGGGTTITDPEIPLAPGLNTEDHFAYVIGYPDGTVRPGSQISRQEVATIFFRLLTDTSRMASWSQTNTFTDVNKTSWSNNAISTMSNAEILTGYPNGTFRPSGNITRGEFAAIAARFDSALYVGEDKFTDIGGHWAAKYINRAAEKGWLSGYEDGTFRPDAYITRAEAMTMINNVLDRRVRAEGLHAEMKMWSDCSSSDWFYFAVQEATNTHDYDRKNPTDNETWSAILPARDWVALEKQWSQAAGGA